MRILVLGGAGAMAEAIARDLVEGKSVEKVVVADINLKKAEERCKALGSDKLLPARVDVTDKDLAKIIGSFDTDVVVNAAWYRFNMLVMPAAIEAGAHYVDLGGLYWETVKQLELDDAAKGAGVTCVPGMGETPGTMNVMAMYAAQKLDKIDRVRMYVGWRELETPKGAKFGAGYSIETILDEFTMRPIVLRKGKIKEIGPLSEEVRFRLRPPLGEFAGYPTLHSELATLPRTLGRGVGEMDLIVAYDPQFTLIVSALAEMGMASREPIDVKGQRVAPYDVLCEVIRRMPPGPTVRDAEGIRVDVVGESGGRRLPVRVDALVRFHERWGLCAGTVGTGVPPSIAAQWLAEGRIKRRGVVPPELAIDPLAFFKELNARGRGIEVYESVGNEFRPLF